MARMTTGYRGLTLLLTVLCVGLAMVIWRETGGAEMGSVPSSAIAQAMPPAAAKPSAAKGAPALPPISAYAEVTERPLFSPSRQPAPPEAAQEDLGNSSAFTLLGIVISEGERMALIEHGKPGVIARLKEGQAVEGWRVQTIEADRVILEHGGTQQPLKLKDLKDRPGAAQPVVRPGVPVPGSRRS
jgi:hypothetical protein